MFLNYDPKSNGDYLMQYGFVTRDNPHDFVGMLASIGSDAPEYAAKNTVSNSKINKNKKIVRVL